VWLVSQSLRVARQAVLMRVSTLAIYAQGVVIFCKRLGIAPVAWRIEYNVEIVVTRQNANAVDSIESMVDSWMRFFVGHKPNLFTPS
jgi:hypothetical protein